VPPLVISTPDLGGISFLTWMQVPSNVQPVDRVGDTVFPVQEMRSFQERWFYLVENNNLAQGEQILLQWLCPQDESWRIDTLGITHNDTGSLDVRVSILAAKGQDGLGDIINKEIEPGFETLLYPARNLQNNVATSIAQEFNGPEGMIILPLETLQIISSATAGVPSVTFKMRGRYQLRPIPIEGPSLSDIEATVTIV